MVTKKSKTTVAILRELLAQERNKLASERVADLEARLQELSDENSSLRGDLEDCNARVD